MTNNLVVFLVCVLLLLACCSSEVAAQYQSERRPLEYPNPEVDPEACQTTSGRLCDPDSVLTREERDRIEAKVLELESKYSIACSGKFDDDDYKKNIQMAIALTQNMNIGPLASPVQAAETHAQHLHNEWGVGFDCGNGKGSTGLLFFLSIDDRAMYLSRGDALAHLSESKRIAILDAAKPWLRKQSYETALLTVIEKLDQELSLLILREASISKTKKGKHSNDNVVFPWAAITFFGGCLAGGALEHNRLRNNNVNPGGDYHDKFDWGPPPPRSYYSSASQGGGKNVLFPVMHEMLWHSWWRRLAKPRKTHAYPDSSSSNHNEQHQVHHEERPTNTNDSPPPRVTSNVLDPSWRSSSPQRRDTSMDWEALTQIVQSQNRFVRSRTDPSPPKDHSRGQETMSSTAESKVDSPRIASDILSTTDTRALNDAKQAQQTTRTAESKGELPIITSDILSTAKSSQPLQEATKSHVHRPPTPFVLGTRDKSTVWGMAPNRDTNDKAPSSKEEHDSGRTAATQSQAEAKSAPQTQLHRPVRPFVFNNRRNSNTGVWGRAASTRPFSNNRSKKKPKKKNSKRSFGGGSGGGGSGSTW